MHTRFRKHLTRVLLSVLVTATATPAGAQPVRGLSLFGGLAFHSSEVADGGNEYDSDGVTLGVDYQVPKGRGLSLVPFFSWSLENTEELAQDPSVRHSILGVEGRAWFRDLFVGLHAGFYRQVVEGDTYEESGTGPGWGLSMGVEGPGRLYVMGRYVEGESLEVWDSREVDVTGLRLLAGLRFR